MPSPRAFRANLRRVALWCGAGAVALSACTDSLLVGSQVIWSARHEAEDLREWEGEGRGGLQGDEGMLLVTDERAHSGRFALRLTNPAHRVEAGGCVGRGFESLSEGYLSAWYFLPRAPTTRSAWTVLRLRSFGAVSQGSEQGMGGQAGHANLAGAPGTELPEWRSVIELGMQSLPDGRLALYVFDHDRDYLRLPLPVPPPLVPVGRWFHLEVFYRTTLEPEGRFVVWLDGEPVYSVSDRPLGDGSNVYFALCNMGQSEEEEPVELFVDDALLSRVRATPSAVLE